MGSIDTMVLGNTILTWLLATGVAGVTLAALWLVKRLAYGRLRKFAESTATGVDDLLVVVLGSTRGFAMLALALYAGATLLVLPEAPQRVIDRVLVALLFLQGALWGNAAIRFAQHRLTSRGGDQDAATASALRGMTFAARFLLWGLVVLLMLDNLGVNITGLVAGLGIGGVAVALALQNVLGDLFASLSILLDKPFVVGDFVVVDAYLGTIEHIGLKTTRLRSLSGEQIIMSNADLLASRIRNFKRMTERRVVLPIDITYQTTPSKLGVVSTIIRRSIAEEGETRLDRVHFKEFGGSALRFEAVYYVLNPDYNRFMDIQEAINMRIFERFGAEGIEFAYPTQTVFVQGAGGVASPQGTGTEGDHDSL